MIKWLGQPPSGLLLPADLPELTIEAAVERSWKIPPGGQLLQPTRPAWLPTDPVHRSYWSFQPTLPLDYVFHL